MASFVQPSKVKINTGPVKNSFASVLKSNDHKGSPSSDSSPAIVMDDSCIVDNDLSCSLMGKESEDPFGYYSILKRNNQKEKSKDAGKSDPSFPPGFTPKGVNETIEEEENVSVNKSNSNHHCNKKTGSNGKCGSNRSFKLKAGGSILDVMEDLIEIGHAMGYNMEGCLGHTSKKDWIRELNLKYKVNFATIQETKSEKIDLFAIKSLWGNFNFDFVYSPSVGLSGGILCVWNPNVFAKESVTVSDSFVAVRGTWISSSLKLMFVSVYAPQDISERKSLWDYIKHMINLWDGECIILGDFNEVRSENERFGTIFNDIGAKAFNHFISSSCLIDLPLEGYSFTWALKSGSKMSKLDRFLISEGLISIFPSLAAICLDRRLSDHRPILLRESSVDYGPTPFRVFHSWFTKDGFDNLIADTWNNLSIMETNKISLLRKKFQALKAIIKNWSRDEMLKASAVRHSAQSRISELDKLIDKGLSNNDIINERISLLKDIHDLDKRHSSDLAQKAKIQWAIEGDENSKYFHGIINKKRSQLAIRGVLVDGEWIEDPPKVKNEFLEHFSNRFSMPTGQTINLDSHMFQKISIDQNADLESDVSLEEIKKAVWECGTNKSPGPDGFSFEFIRKYWNIIQHDVVNAVKEFFSSSKFPPGSNSSFITLIPKSLDAKMVKDFRPISLIGSFYKIVAKILSNRLCIVMPDLISDVQTAFISKRQILDGPFILNELISWCKYHKIKAMIFKADFEKAFDSVRWDYLDGVLNNFGFGVKWRGWIQACLSSAMGSILVNGSPSSEFKFYKGLKQGDPLSPFLFILVMESLHISFNNILNSGLYKGIRIDESLTLSHLFYADDAVFIGKWDKANVITIVNMLKCFYLASGLKINIQKSKIMGIGTSQEEVDVAANVIGCNTFSSPFNYLGVKVGSSSSRSNFWDEVIAKLSSRLSKWKIKMLSIGGRFTLNKAVLSSLPIYLMSIYKTPVGVLRKMESIRRRFFNGADINENKMSMIGWEKIMVSRKKGGLGISSFFAQNRALLFKWIWRFRSKDSSLWYRVIKAMFGDGGALDNTGKFARSSTWTTIVRECGNLSSKGINLLSHMKRKVGNGLNTLFWVDSWLTDIPLKQLYPRMFALDCNKNSTVAEKINASSISCSFRRLPRGSLEEEQFSKLVEDVNSVILSVSNDRWIWSLDSSGEFSIKSTRLFIDDHLLLAVGAPTRWVSEVPIKINIMAWKVSLDKLPTRLNLSLRGIEIPSITCPICSCAGESCSHLFFSCSMARNITTKLARWWEFDCPDLFSYDDWLEWFHTLRLLKGFKDILEGVVSTKIQNTTSDADVVGAIMDIASRAGKEGRVAMEITIHDFNAKMGRNYTLQTRNSKGKVVRAIRKGNPSRHSMKILENKLESLKLQENQPVDGLFTVGRPRGRERAENELRGENEPSPQPPPLHIMVIDKSWTSLGKHEKAFYTGLKKFVDDCKPLVDSAGNIRCPCKSCRLVLWVSIKHLSDHISKYGFDPSYKTWIHHGEPDLPPPPPVIDNTRQPQMSDMTACLNDLSYIPLNNEQNEPTQGDIGETSNDPTQAKRNEFEELYASANEELYPGCDYVTRLDFMAKFTYFKVKGKLTDSIFNEMLEFFQNVFPTAKGYKLPPSYYAIKKTFKTIGLGWKDNNTSGKKVPKKVLRYFSIIPRLQHLYKSSHTTKEMTWHATGKCTEPGLAADGFNPFGNLSQSYSMWPVILTTYNLPPWLCMKESSFMLTLLIPILKSPGKDIDVYLRPLINDLKDFWAKPCVENIDVATCQKFNMRAMVLWTINNFLLEVVYLGGVGKKPHKWRRSLDFNGEIEDGDLPRKFDRDGIMAQLARLPTRAKGKHPMYGSVKIKRNIFVELN
ncbi:RNA-directed DNA polymerase, eukaryota [Tanacetum coccineum]